MLTELNNDYEAIKAAQVVWPQSLSDPKTAVQKLL
jgi:hypothetical protein